MQPHSIPLGHPAQRVQFYSPGKDAKIFQYPNYTAHADKQKSVSYHVQQPPIHYQYRTKPSFSSQATFNQLQPMFPKQNYPTFQKTQSNKTNNESESGQKLFDSKRSQLQFEQKNIEKRISDPQNHTKNVDWKNKMSKFQSLRSTLTNPRPTFKEHQFGNVQRKVHRKSNEMSIVEIDLQKINMKKPKKQSSDLKNQHSLKPSQVQHLGNSIIYESFPKESQYHQELQKEKNEFQQPKKKRTFLHFTQKKNASKSIKTQQKRSNNYLQPKVYLNNENLLQIKQERRFPSFLSSRGQKRQEKSKFKQFKKISPFKQIGQNSQVHAQKTPQNKRLTNNKHAKSFSVFETLGILKKKNIANNNKSVIQEVKSNNEHFFEPKKQSLFKTFQKQNYQRGKANTIHERQVSFGQECLTPNFPKSSKNNFEQKPHVGALSLRQSLDKFAHHTKSIRKMQFQNWKKRQTNDSPKVQMDHQVLKQNLFGHARQKSQQFHIHFQQPTKQQQKQPSNKVIETIDDIKQVLINCNLFSEEDYQGVFQNHKKDLLKPSSPKAAQSVKFKLQPLHKTSLKQLVDPSQSEGSRYSTEEQKRLAQLAQMCEQKRSKWILQQTDTIKESLKELSQFNTQKTLYDNQWKTISIKDFGKDFQGRRNRHRVSCQYQGIDEVRQQELGLQSSKQSNNLLSETAIDENREENDNSLCPQNGFRKNKFGHQAQDVFSKIKKANSSEGVDLSDFEIRWCSQQPIIVNQSSSSVQNTFVVYWARHKLTGSIFTIKRYEKQILQSLGLQFQMNFIQKLKIQMLQLSHPNVEKVYGIFCDRINIYLICQFTEMRLLQVIAQKPQQTILTTSEECIQMLNGINSEEKRALLFREVIQGLKQVHLNHIVHKTLQPNNILIVFGTCKITGFQSSQIVDKPQNRMCNSYTCPQVIFDSTRLAMDIWSLGILAYEILIGRKPFQSQNDNNLTIRKILQCNFDIPFQKVNLCEQILNLTLRRNPKERGSIFDVNKVWSEKLRLYAGQELNREFFMQSQLIKALDW